MSREFRISALLLALACIGGFGCNTAPGKPGAVSEASRPDKVSDFPTLYKQNCAGCHGAEGRGGAALSLSNPEYIAFAGRENIQRITKSGVAGTQMPPFGRNAGGLLTDQQIQILANGIVETWGRPGVLSNAVVPAYAATSAGDPARGGQAFVTFCARCHGSDGGGDSNKPQRVGSIVDPSYLALVSDQSLRTAIVAGFPERQMPDWRSDLTATEGRAMTDQEVTDVVTWLAGHRSTAPGQPYQARP